MIGGAGRALKRAVRAVRRTLKAITRPPRTFKGRVLGQQKHLRLDSARAVPPSAFAGSSLGRGGSPAPRAAPFHRGTVALPSPKDSTHPPSLYLAFVVFAVGLLVFCIGLFRVVRGMWARHLLARKQAAVERAAAACLQSYAWQRKLRRHAQGLLRASQAADFLGARSSHDRPGELQGLCARQRFRGPGPNIVAGEGGILR